MGALTLSLAEPWKTTRVLLAVALALICLSSAGQIAKYGFGRGWLQGFIPLFYVDMESNIPTWFSSLLLFFAAALLSLIALAAHRAGRPFVKRWLLLSFIFVFLSADEIAMMHEIHIEALRTALGTSGLLYYAWVIPGLLFVAITVLIYLPFLLKLERGLALRFVLAGAVYVGGAVGVEMVSGAQHDLYGQETWRYAALVTLEELCEMLGAVIFIHALLGKLRDDVGEVRLVSA